MTKDELSNLKKGDVLVNIHTKQKDVWCGSHQSYRNEPFELRTFHELKKGEAIIGTLEESLLEHWIIKS